ncbi:LytTR family DNA-binding domain-containing protein [Erysipelotrichaceae bacterium 51-3]
MISMKILILEDCQNDIKTLQSILNELNLPIELKIVNCLSDLDYLGDSTFDIGIIDIDISGKSSIDIMKKKSGLFSSIIYYTNYESYMPQAFGRNVIGFVRKDEKKEHLIELIEEACWSSQANYLSVISNKKPITIPVGSVLFVEKDLRQILIHTRNDCFPVSHFSLGKIQEQSNNKFIQISQSVLVNPFFIQHWNGDEILIQNGQKLYPSRRMKSTALKEYTKRL